MEPSRNRVADLIRQLREQFGRELRAQADGLEAAENGVRELRDRQRQLEESFEQQIDVLEKLMGSEPHSATIAPPAATRAAPMPAGQVQRPGLSDSAPKVLNDAQRFARLLVSEIELYHPEQVTEGREHRDLYARLRSAIERSRQAYEKRFGATAAKDFQYFHDELVRTLASNDAALLGPEYPGPTL